MITIRYEVSHKAVKKEFIERGYYLREDNNERWLKLEFDAASLTKDQRQLIWDNCTEVGNGDFIYESHYINVVCHTIGELLEIIDDD